MTMGSIGERSGRWFHSLIFFRHVDTDMSTLTWSKCIYPPWNFANLSTQNDGIYEIHVPIHHFWYLCLCLFFEGVFQEFSNIPLEATDATVYEGTLFIWRFEDGQLGYAPGVCRSSIGFMFSNECFEIREVNNIFRHADVSGDFGWEGWDIWELFFFEVVLKIYCWEANPNFHEPWKKRQGDQGANQVLVDQVWDWTSCEITWFHSLTAVGGRRVGAGEAGPLY